MQKCNTCHRAGDNLATCGSSLTCPGRVGVGESRELDPHSPNFPQVDPSKDIVLQCEACKQTVALSAHDVLVGLTRVDFKCARSKEHCGARVVVLSLDVDAARGDIYQPVTTREKPAHGSRKKG